MRVLAAFVALLLTASALGQAAHFLLVPHAICAEHGELLELDERAEHQARGREAAAESSHQAQATAPDASVEHDHCQVLARGQREQALPAPGAVAWLPAALVEKAAVFSAPPAFGQSLPTLSLAPKTSPPPPAVC